MRKGLGLDLGEVGSMIDRWSLMRGWFKVSAGLPVLEGEKYYVSLLPGT